MMAAIPYTFPSPSPVYTRARVITRDTKWRIMIFRCDNPGNIAISSVKSLFHTRQPTPVRLLSMFTRRYTMNNRRPEISRAWKFSFSRERRGEEEERWLISTQFTDHAEWYYFDERAAGLVWLDFDTRATGVMRLNWSNLVGARHVSVVENDRRSMFVSWSYQLTTLHDGRSIE